jgi:glycosyltransferase involved in cell wall biosynthesis
MTTFFSSPKYTSFYGLDLPFIKSRGKKIIYRSTGYDVRTRTKDIKFNPYSPFRYGFDLGIEERRQKKYLDYLKDYVDVFICQDPEMKQYLPDAQIIPRSIDVNDWSFVGVKNNKIPKVVHAPSKMSVKGTHFILKAVEELSNEGLKFEFNLVQGLKQEEAIEIYKQADICIDQILIGWYGVFSIECMALGKPVIAYIRDDLADKQIQKIPIINANPDNIKTKLKEIILDYERRKELSILSRKYVENVHDVTTIANKTKLMYQNVLLQPFKTPTTLNDLDYLSIQFSENVDSDYNKPIIQITYEYIIQRLQRRKGTILSKLATGIDRIVKSLSYRGFIKGILHILSEPLRKIFYK